MCAHQWPSPCIKCHQDHTSATQKPPCRAHQSTSRDRSLQQHRRCSLVHSAHHTRACSASQDSYSSLPVMSVPAILASSLRTTPAPSSSIKGTRSTCCHTLCPPSPSCPMHACTLYPAYFYYMHRTHSAAHKGAACFSFTRSTLPSSIQLPAVATPSTHPRTVFVVSPSCTGLTHMKPSHTVTAMPMPTINVHSCISVTPVLALLLLASIHPSLHLTSDYQQW